MHCRIFRVTGVNAEVAEDGEEELDYVYVRRLLRAQHVRRVDTIALSDVRPEGMVCQVDLFMAVSSLCTK